MCFTKVFMYHPLSTFTICIFRPFYFLHLNFVRSYCSWPPFHTLAFLNFHFIHEFQHELEATLSYQKTTMRSILKVLLHEQPLNSPKFQKLADFMLLWHDTIMTSFQMFHETADKLQVAKEMNETIFQQVFIIRLNRINLLLQFLLMLLGLLCFPSWICIPWNFIKASATLNSK